MIRTNSVFKTEKDRIGYIDFLKFVALSGIIIAHINPPSLLMCIRAFDVPLMVIISSILGSVTYSKFRSGDFVSMGKYIVSRMKRLVIPTWIFLAFFFVLQFVLSGKPNTINYYISSFLLTRYGIGYVWIMLIYIYSALLIPLFDKMKLSLKNVFFVILVYFAFEILYYFKIGTDNPFLDSTFYYIIPYGLLTFIGFNYNKMQRKAKLALAASSFAIFVGLAFFYRYTTGSFQSVQICKYPPRIYFLSYGICCSFFMLLFCENHTLKIYGSKFVTYISKHSMWIYLWHILALKAYSIFKLPNVWFIKLIVVYSFSLCAVFIVNIMLSAIDKNNTIHFFKYLR